MSFTRDAFLDPVTQSESSYNPLYLDSSFESLSGYIGIITNPASTDDTILACPESTPPDPVPETAQAPVDTSFPDSGCGGSGELANDANMPLNSSVDSARYPSQLEKAEQAAIALNLQRRLEDAGADAKALSSDSSTNFSSPCLPDLVHGSSSPEPLPTKETAVSSSTSSGSDHDPSSTPVSSRGEPAGGMEMVFDLNMNTATNLPRKQKLRSPAQKESFNKVREHGACEKHRKQHKRVSRPHWLFSCHDNSICVISCHR